MPFLHVNTKLYKNKNKMQLEMEFQWYILELSKYFTGNIKE